ncbi:MAG: hypothetical protein H0Z39_00370 [Peptococcaceae bacterium]|nr:hypothetical protein [Peptococcaceae bacterium]
MFEKNNQIREEFFKWCEETVLSYSEEEGTVLEYWRPRRKDTGDGYVLRFKLKEGPEREVEIPSRYTQLLDEEFPEHDEEEEDGTIH